MRAGYQSQSMKNDNLEAGKIEQGCGEARKIANLLVVRTDLSGIVFNLRR